MTERNDDERDPQPLEDEESDHLPEGEATDDASASDPDALHTEIIDVSEDVSDSDTAVAAGAEAGSDDDQSELSGDSDDIDNDDLDHDTEILNFHSESSEDEDELDADEDELDADIAADDLSDDESSAAVRRTSWWKVVGGIAAACAVFGMVAWGLGLSVAGDEASDAELAAQLPDDANAPAQQKGSAPSKNRNAEDDDTESASDEDSGSPDEDKKQVTSKNQGKPPKVAIQIFDTKQGLCPDYFELSINVYVVKGQVDRGMARLTIPAQGKIRSYPLYEVQGDFSNILRGIPTSMTAKLYIRVEGPNGVTEEWHDVTHSCPGKKLDDVEKTPKELKKDKKLNFKVPKMKDLFDEEALEALEDLGLNNKDTSDKANEKSDSTSESTDE